MSAVHSDASWSMIPGFEGIYEASTEGQIRRIGRATGARAGRVKTLSSHNAGYLATHLYRDNVESSALVHRLIAETFLGPIPDGHEVNHKNGIKTDNRLCNIEIITHRGNVDHAIATGLQDVRGERNPQAKLTRSLVEAIRADYRPGTFGYKRLAVKYGVSWGTIRNVIKQRNWSPDADG
jgi:hypothetical protein